MSGLRTTFGVADAGPPPRHCAGDKAAMAAVGHMYANGRGVQQDNETAIEWFTRAASDKSGAPDPSALFGLGYMQLHGYGAHSTACPACSVDVVMRLGGTRGSIGLLVMPHTPPVSAQRRYWALVIAWCRGLAMAEEWTA